MAALPTDATIDSAVPTAGTPNRGLVNTLLKSLMSSLRKGSAMFETQNGTYANMLAVSTPASGDMFFVASGIWQGLYRYNGTRWIPHGGGVRTYADNSSVTAPADTLENNLRTITIPGGMMGPQGIIRVTEMHRFTGAAANRKYWKVNLAGATHGDDSNGSDVNVVGARIELEIVNQNSVSSQKSFQLSGQPYNEIRSALVTSAVDMSVDQTLTFIGRKELSTDTLTSESILIEVFPG